MEQLTKTMQRIDHNGKEIYFADYSKVDMLELANEIRTNVGWLNENASSLLDTLFLVDVSDCHVDMEAFKAFQASAKALKANNKGSAVVGVTGPRKIFMDAVNRFSSMNTKTFHSREDAIEWLVNL